MKYKLQNRRQFLTKTGKAGIALASMPIITKVMPDSFLELSEFQQQALPYAYNALEPYIDAMTMEIHYTKHAANYAKSLNEAIIAEKVDTTTTTLTSILQNISSYSTKMRNNAGGHYNHELFWKLMKPAPTSLPTGNFLIAIQNKFGSFSDFQKSFEDAAKARFGSGWAWLIVKKDGAIAITSTPNQDNPLMNVAETQGMPLLALDVWEHAYYLKYQNRRPDYIKNFWNLVNWDYVQQRFEKYHHS